MARRLPGLWIVAIALVPAATLASIVVNGENVPFFDQWSLTRLFRAQDAGSLDLSAFWAQHNEHRPLFPRAVDFGLAYVTKWDIRVELYLNFVVAAAGFALLVVALRRTLARNAFLMAVPIASVVYFSPVQWENWLWGWELEWFLCNLAALGALWLLTTLPRDAPTWRLAAAAGCAVVSTFSLGQGLLVWPVGVAVLVARRRPWRVWSLLGVVVWAAYFATWENPSNHPSKTLAFEQPVEFAEFVVLYFGRVFAVSQPTGGIVGLVLLAAFAAGTGYVIRRRERELVDATAFWVGLGLYVLGAGILTGVSRTGFGLEGVLLSRYSGMAALFAIATMALLLTLLRREEVRARVPPSLRGAAVPAVALPLVLGALVNLPSGFRGMERRGDDLDKIAACTRRAQSPDDPCLQRPRSGRRGLQWPGILFLRDKGWAGYRPLSGDGDGAGAAPVSPARAPGAPPRPRRG